jgi:CRISPR-associated endonuclease Csn1
MEKKCYFLGLDIGTDSTGYAVTDEAYKLQYYHGERMWGAHLFDAAQPAADRRGHRTARRRGDRSQWRVRLLRELFASAIAPIDPKFFTRIDDAWKFRDDKRDTTSVNAIFDDIGFTDKEYYKQYPTIHHLIMALIEGKAAPDPRLLYLACAWLMKHRGHFFSDVDVNNINKLNDPNALYEDLMAKLHDLIPVVEEDEVESEFSIWECESSAFIEILKRKCKRAEKEEAFNDLLFGGKKAKKVDSEPFSREAVIKLLCGYKVTLEKLFNNESYADVEPKEIELSEEDATFEAHCLAVGDGEGVLKALKALYDWSLLERILNGEVLISKSKVQNYDQHKRDLKQLKAFIQKYLPAKYDEMFKSVGIDNYVAYVKNAKKATEKHLKGEKIKNTNKEKFTEYLTRTFFKGFDTNVLSDVDAAFYDDMMLRLEQGSFLPKQVQTDNRVIPYQLYQYELREMLMKAKGYLPFLNEVSDGFTVAEKIESIFTFRVPYYVGPLVSEKQSPFAWMVRKANGRILPWNFTEKIDLEKSEEAFIRRMTNVCTYLPGEDVLSETSLLYQKFKVLNEINLLRINGVPLTVEDKQAIYHEVFEKRKKPTRKQLLAYLKSNNLLHDDDVISGIDEEIKNSLSSYHQLKGVLDKGILTEEECEQIIERFTFTEDKARQKQWLVKTFGKKLAEADIKSICKCQFKNFGRLSREFLDGIIFEDKLTNECDTVIGFLWKRNVILMELTAHGQYTLSEILEECRKEYYASPEHPQTIEAKMQAAYLSPAVKRQVYRALDVVGGVRKAMGCDPARIFVEMARGEEPAKKGKRTQSRKEMLDGLYKEIDNHLVHEVQSVLRSYGDSVNDKLQSRALYLWSLQLGKCPYCGKPIHIESLQTEACDIDHIIPRSILKDDSLQNNLVLAHKMCNGSKTDTYPVPETHREESLWKFWYDKGLITKEKYQRLMRRMQLTDAELQGFINRQLVETRQTVKAVFHILEDLFPKTKVIPVKAGLVSDYRQEFHLLKTRSVNDLHHAKDAYLNIVVGNVYYEKFTRDFNIRHDKYSLKPRTLFGCKLIKGDKSIWNGQDDVDHVKKTIENNYAHLTKYAYYSKGGLFDQMPVKAGNGQVPLKADAIHQKTERYGAYNKSAAYGFLPIAYVAKKGKKTINEIVILALELRYKTLIDQKDQSAIDGYITRAIQDLQGVEPISITYPMGMKPWKVGTILQLNQLRMVLRGKSGGGKQLLLSLITPLTLPVKLDKYVKRLDAFQKKKKENKERIVYPQYDKITAAKNLKLYDALVQVFTSTSFGEIPALQKNLLSDVNTRTKFQSLSLELQVDTLLNIIMLGKTNRAGGCNLSAIGGAGAAGVLTLSAFVSNWQGTYQSVRLISSDASGLFVRKSENLLDLL